MSTTATLPSSTTCTHPNPGKNGYLPPDACDVILFYIPSLGAAILFTILFGITFIAFGVQAFIYRKKYSWVIMMGASWECLAFVFRALLTRHQSNGGYNTTFTLLFYLAPLWINAFLYMTLGRLIYFLVPEQRLAGIPATRYGVIFIWLDIIAFIIQAAGALITTDTDASTKLVMIGVHIYMGGIGLQQLFIIIFTFLFIRLHHKLRFIEQTGALRPDKTDEKARPWRWLIYVMYFGLFMITVRIIFRLCQYSRGTDPNNPVLTHEFYEYVFDAVPMLLALLALNLIHPGMVLRGVGSEFPSVSWKEKRRQRRADRERKKQSKLNGSDDPRDIFGSLSIQEGGSTLEAMHHDSYWATGQPR
ncbi:RTA1 like protein-domain-containing protein [Aspergillus ambiguus]|uniref:RTA1 domain-containing protein n=1 Tax=Aspergillus ambiguus TaxID=176160 RepID=UPI003CCD9B0E